MLDFTKPISIETSLCEGSETFGFFALKQVVNSQFFYLSFLTLLASANFPPGKKKRAKQTEKINLWTGICYHYFPFFLHEKRLVPM